MTALFSTRRRAEELDAALDGRSPVVSEELRALVAVATKLRTQECAPRSDFSLELRERLMAEAEQALVAGAPPLVLPVRERGPRERRLVAAASVMVLVGGTAGLAAAAQQALPGEALYPLKRGIEAAEAELSVSEAGRGRDLLNQADGRLAEVEGLLAGSADDPQVPATIADFTEQAQQGAELLLASFEEDRDPAAIDAVRDFTARALGTLQQIARTAPPAAQDELATAALVLSEIDSRAAALCGSCGSDLPPLEVPGMFLAAADVSRAFSAVEGRFAQLDNSHPFVVDKRVVKAISDPTRLIDDDGDKEPDGGPSSGPTGGPAPEEPLIDLPGGTDVAQGDETVDDTVGQITDGLGGVVATVLPEPGDTD